MTASASSPAEQNDEAEREALQELIGDFLPTTYPMGESGWDYAGSIADAILAAGFRRSSSTAASREWGYEYPLGGIVAVAGGLSEKSARFYSEASPDRTLVNRTPAGPWLPVRKGDE